MLCHGQGDLARDGCCYVEGNVCPLRWKIENDHVYDAAGTDLGTTAAIAASYTSNKKAQQNILDQITGTTFLCKAAINVLAARPALVNDRAGFQDAWDNEPNYVAQVRPAWERLEQRLGMAPGTYNCSRWKGTGASQCCFAETQADNDTKAAKLTANARGLRSRG